MNIFKEAQRLYTGIDASTIIEAENEFLSLASQIRLQLGKRGFQLDYYLEMLLGAAKQCQLIEIYDTASQDFADIRRVCLDITSGTNRLKDHVYYLPMKTYIDSRLRHLQDEYTVISMACSYTAKMFLRQIMNKHFSKLNSDFRNVLDIGEVHEIYQELVKTSGEQTVDKLNEMLHTRFLLSTPGKIYLQAFTTEYIAELLHRDRESGKLVIQILLDDKEKTMA